MMDSEDKKRIIELLADWQEVRAQRAELSTNNKQIVKEAAQILEVKPKIINKFFRYLDLKMNDGTDELDLLNELALQVEE